MLHRSTNYILFSFGLDFLSLQAAILLAGWLRVTIPLGKELVNQPYILYLILEASLLFPLVFLLFNIYDPDRKLRVIDEYQAITVASLIADMVLAGVVYFTIRDLSRLNLVYVYGLHFILVIGWRDIARVLKARLNGKGYDLRKVLLVGGGEIAERTVQRLTEMNWAGIALAGYLSNNPQVPAGADVPHLGTLQDAERVIRETGVDDVLIALPAEDYEQIEELVSKLVDKACNIWVIPDYFSLLLYGSEVADLSGLPLISLKAPVLNGYQRLMKRAFDLLLGGLLFLISLPLLGILSLAIRLDSPGPVIFKQERVGENGRLFWVYKFRSMVVNAEQRMAEVVKVDERGNILHKTPEDPRVTRVGRYLRRVSLDELPQLINVIKGEMSLVGPRPELPLLVEMYQTWQRKRFAVPPGITGWWQVNGRSDRPMHLHTEDDLYYIQHYSLLLDLQILLRTAWVVLRGRGAY